MMRTCPLLSTVLILSLCATAHPGDWPQWRGPGRDGHSTDTGLLDSWPEDGPPVDWEVETVGAAFSSVAVADGRVYTQGNVDEEGRIICLDEQTGQTLWSARHPAEKKVYTSGRGDGARGTPTVDGRFVYAESGAGALACLEADTGRPVWSLHLVHDLDGKIDRRPWGYSESPLVDGDRLIVTPGGKEGAVAALDKRTGDVVWRSTDVTEAANYSSPILARVDGVRQIIQFTQTRVVGLDAATGDLLWEYKGSANTTANICTPIYAQGRVFSSSAYGTGAGLAKLVRTGDGWKAEEVYFVKAMATKHGGNILHDGYVYGFSGSVMICLDFATGEVAWRNRSVSRASLCYADGNLYCLGQNQKLVLVEANPGEYVEKGRVELPDSGERSWAHPAVANGRLYIRDQQRLTAFDVRAAGGSQSP